MSRRRLALLAFALSVLAAVAYFVAARLGADRVRWDFAYDDQGRIVETATPGGQVTRVTYEPAGGGAVRKVVKTRPDGSQVTLEFDGFGRRTRMTDPAGATRYEYDGFGRLVRLTREGVGSISYEYDTLGRVTAMDFGGGLRVGYAYDFLGRLERMDTPAGPFTYSYRPAEGRVVRTSPNGVRLVSEYQQDERLRSLTHVGPDNRVLASFRYSYRPDGLIASVVEFVSGRERQLDYGYDSAQRLASVKGSDGSSFGYRYDEVGNLLEVVEPGAPPSVSTYDWAGRMRSHDGTEALSNAAGNVERYSSGGRTRSFRFNVSDLLAAASSGEDDAISFTYDGDGRLIARSIDNEASSFLADPVGLVWRPFVESSDRGPRRLFVWDGDVPIAVISNGVHEFFLNDYLGSVRATVGTDGEIRAEFQYSPFGRPSGDETTPTLRPGFAGLFYEPVASVYLTRARAYDPHLARFLQRDPLRRLPSGLSKTLSDFAYSGGDPMNFVDADGADPGKAADRSRTPDYAREFLNSINQRYAHFDDALVLGLGSGVRPFTDILNDAQGRYQVIDITQSGSLGRTADAVNYLLTGGRDPVTNRQIQPSWTANAVDCHSAGCQASFAGSGNVRRLDPSSQSSLSHEDTYRQGWVSRLTSAELQGSKGNVGFGFSAKFTSNPLEAVAEVAKDVGDFIANVPTVVGGKATGKLGDWHSYTRFRDQLASEGALESAGTYDNHVQLVARDGVYHFSREGSTGQWTLNRITSTPTEYRPATGVAGTGLSATPARSTDDRSSKWSVGASSSTTAGGGGGGTGTPIGICGGTDGPWWLRGTPAAPSKVGGIYLRGAADALSHLGSLRGVAFDRQTGRVVLISEDRGDVGLPPLRLDDVATVFRSVYEHGESPWVTIDPDPKDPRGPTMLVRHGESTAQTYVGWVLFEADRLMKVYSLGKDNVTQQPFASAIPGYANMLTLGGAEPRGGPDASTWERFWIKPAAVNRRKSGAHDLTLLDVPLMVETEPMVLRGGKLETALGKKPSREADAFSRWFTDNYDRIAQEARSVPPPGTGITTPVPVFAELRRIALISAVAEALRDQGVEFPQWLRDHEVAKVPVSPTTPSTRATYEGERVRRQIYGGATLSPADRDVHVMPNDAAAGALAPAVWRTASNAVPFSEVAFERDGARYKAVVLPGNDTRDLGASHVEEVDLVVPLPRGEELRLVRHFHSFFSTDGALGGSWTFDYPRLQRQRRPTLRTGSRAEYRIVYALSSPLNSYSGTFAGETFVPEVNGQLIVPEQPNDALGLTSAREPRAPEATHELLFRDGRRLLFDESGNLVAWRLASTIVCYPRDARGRVQAIQAWQGGRPAGDIQLRYDDRDRLVEAKAGNGAVARYSYGPDGMLNMVTGESGSVKYRYAGGLLTGIARNDGAARKFEYDGQGRLLRESDPDGSGATWTLKRDDGGITVRKTAVDGKTTLSLAKYDLALEPLFEETAGARKVAYTREADGTRVATVTMPGDGQYVVRRSADGRKLSWRYPEGGSYALDAGQAVGVTRLLESGRLAAVWQAGPDGLLESATYETFAARPQYDSDGGLRTVLLTTPQSAKTFDRWLSVEYDEAGRVGVLRDYSGLGMQVTYDRTGEPTEFRSTRGAAKFVRDDQGRLQAVSTSWGFQLRNSYDASSGQLWSTAVEQGGATAVVEFENGMPTKVRQFNGGEFLIAYDKKGEGQLLVSSVKTPTHLRLTYEYDAQGRTTTVNCGRSYRLEYTYDDQGRLVRMVQAPLAAAGK